MACAGRGGIIPLSCLHGSMRHAIGRRGAWFGPHPEPRRLACATGRRLRLGSPKARSDCAPRELIFTIAFAPAPPAGAGWSACEPDRLTSRRGAARRGRVSEQSGLAQLHPDCPEGDAATHLKARWSNKARNLSAETTLTRPAHHAASPTSASSFDIHARTSRSPRQSCVE